ncbi:MAG: hypothetical protein RLZZ511_2942 [Cyanobacteriota bacterium]|jgi:hypothetical protein
MERGLLWLPLLVLFFGLAWAGWNEYSKIEAYKVWAADFDRAKYDIRAVLGQSGQQITWGLPDRRQPQALESFALSDVTAIQVLVNGDPIDLQNPPAKGNQVALEFLRSGQAAIAIPFTEVDLAVKWATALQQDLL